MDNHINELQIYKIVSAMSGEVLYQYDIAEDEMTFYYGNTDSAKFGSGFRHYLDHVKQVYSRDVKEFETVSRILNIVHTGTPGFFEEKMNLRTMNGGSQYSLITGRCLYDDNNAPNYIVGCIREAKAAVKGTEEISEGVHVDSLTGIFDRSSFKHKLQEVVNANEDVIRAYLLFSIDDLRDNCTNNILLENNVIVSVVQVVKRVYPYNVILGRVRYDEIGIFYTGHDVENEFLAFVDTLDQEIRKLSIDGLKRPITISGGVYFDNMKDVDSYDMRDRTRIAQIAASSRGKGRIVPYRKELESVYNSHFNLEAEYNNAHFDYNLVEQAMDIMSDSKDAEESINTLLHKIGSMYNLDRITVRSYDEEHGTLPVLARWVNVHSESSVSMNAIVNYELVQELHSGLKDIYIDDEQGAVICRYIGTFGDKGIIDFKTKEKSRHWSEREIRTFKLLTKLTSAYLLNMRAYVDLLRKNEEEKSHDVVTGFIKYDRFIEDSMKYIEEHPNANLAILYTSMKDFVAVNNRYGYDVGDVVLKAYADELTQTEDRVVIGCRRHADNFVALVNCFDLRGNPISAAMIDRMSQSFQRKMAGVCEGVDLAINAGVVFLPKEVTELRSYVDRALMARDKARADDTINCVLA